MTLYQELLNELNERGSASVIPFKVIRPVVNEVSDDRSEFLYDESLVGYLLCMWAKQSVDSTANRLSFFKVGNKLVTYKNF